MCPLPELTNFVGYELEQREHERKEIIACVYLSYLSAIHIYLLQQCMPSGGELRARQQQGFESH